MLTQNEAMGAATASDGCAPKASVLVRNTCMTSCINIKRRIGHKTLS